MLHFTTIRRCSLAPIALAFLATAIGCDQSAPPLISDVGCIEGDFVINRTDELADLRSARCITGDLVLNNPNIKSIEANFLQEIDGDLVIVDTEAPTAAFPALETIGGSILVQSNSLLANVDAPVLERVDGDVVVSGNPLIAVLAMSALQSAGGDVTVSGNSNLDALSLGAATTIGGSLSLISNRQLGVVDVGQVESVGGSLVFADLPLATLNMRRLAHVERSLVLERLEVTDVDLAALTSIDGPLQVRACQQLKTMAFHEDIRLVDVEFQNLPLLESFDFLAGRLAAQMQGLSFLSLGSATFDDLFEGVVDVDGTIFFQNNQADQALSFPDLVHAGNVDIYDFNFSTSVAFPALIDVDNNFSTYVNGTTLGSLETVGGNLAIAPSSTFNNVAPDLSTLVSVGGVLSVTPFPRSGLAALQSVGQLRLDSDLLDSTVSFPALLDVTNQIDIFNGNLNLELPLLTALPNLSTYGFSGHISIPLVEEIAALRIDQANTPVSFDAPSLTTLLFVNINYGWVPQGIDLDTLGDVFVNSLTGGGLGFIGQATSWESGNISFLLGATHTFENLEEVTGSLTVRYLNEVTTLGFPVLTSVGGNGLEISNNSLLQNLDLSALQSVPNMSIYGLPAFNMCELSELVDALVDAGMDEEISYFDFDLDSCPAT